MNLRKKGDIMGYPQIIRLFMDSTIHTKDYANIFVVCESPIMNVRFTRQFWGYGVFWMR